MVSSGGPRGNPLRDATVIVNRNFPEAVQKEIFKNDRTQATKSLKIDASKAEAVFGIKFLPWEEQVKSVGSQYLKLMGESTSAQICIHEV